MSVAEIISLDEWRMRNGDHGPEDPPPFTPALRLVDAHERPGEGLRLDAVQHRSTFNFLPPNIG